MRTKPRLKSTVLLISDRIAAASRGPNKSLFNQEWIRRQYFSIRLKPEFCREIDVVQPTEPTVKGQQSISRDLPARANWNRA